MENIYLARNKTFSFRTSYLFMNVIGLIAISALVGQLCGYGLESVQLSIFNDILLYPFATKIVLLLLGLVVVLLNAKVKIVRVVFIPTILLFIYLSFLAVMYFSSGKDPYYLIVGFNVYYSMSFLFLVAYQLRGFVSTYLLSIIIVCIGVPAIVLGMLQFFLHLPFPSPQPNAPILFFSFLRAYSFFGQPAQYSIFLLFIFAFFGSMLLRHHNQGATHGHSILIFTFMVIIVIAAYTTLTRSLLLAMVVATITLVITNFRFRNKYIIVYSLPFIYLFIIVFALYYAHDISNIFSDPLTSSKSVSIRYEEWHYYANMLFRSPNVFFMGNGIVQGNHAAGSLNAAIPIDNSFLGVAINIGFVGLFIYLSVFGGMWIFLVNEAKNKSSISIESALVFFSTWPIYAIIGNILYLYPLCVLIYLVGDRE